MNLELFGYRPELEKFSIENKLTGFQPGRVIAEHKERYVVVTGEGETRAEITGNIRFTAKSREDFPAVGDWVLLMQFEPGNAIIHRIFPRKSLITRKSAGQEGEIQVIAANVDVALILQAADRDFSINRLERYLAVCYASKVEPAILLTKTDLVDDIQKEALTEKIKSRIREIPVIAVSNETREGYKELEKFFQKGKTYCLLGSSGVGKSTLINHLAGKEVMQTAEISMSSQRGKHVTTHRELLVSKNGIILIDNPGMREIGLAGGSGGIETTFSEIMQLAEKCRYPDCTHIHEAGCAVIEAVENGEIDKAAYENYLKLAKEKKHFEATAAEKRRRDRQFGKMMKDYKKNYRPKGF